MSLKSLFEEEAKPNTDWEQSAQMILVMAELGLPKGMIAELLDFAMAGKLHKDHKRFISAPIIQAQSMWRETTPEWLYKAISYDRLSVVIEELKQGIVGWQIGATELVAVLYPATMDAPMRHEYAQIYLWAGAHANSQHYKKPIEHYWELIGAHVKDEDILNPKGQYHYAYRDLCSDIRRKTVNLEMERERIINRDIKSAKEDTPQSSSDNRGVQLDLF